MRQALERLCTCTAPSGFEGPAAAVAAELLRPLVDEVSIDRMGNVLGVRRSKTPNAPKLLLDAHLDEIGLIVTGVEDGFLRFRSIGGVDPRMLPGRELVVLTDPPLRGLVACPAGGDENKSVPLNELYVDVGLSQEEAERAVPVGTPMVYRAGCFPLGEDQMCGKSMDDRACFVTLLRAAELLRDKELDVELHILGSTREEVSGAGAVVGTWAVAPDFCVAVDVTHGKTPDGPADKTFELGGGPAIGVGPNMTRWMTERMIAKAKEHGIPYQMEIMSGHTGTNGWEMQISREGVATSVLSLPLKYMHTPVETLSLADMEGVAQLLAAFTENLGKEAVR
ncbi:M20/M25/M40 family metallo-hydrolase [uncultured Flavonifractor sp.]|uniref:M20/M25/M40 family metallo-hydrolase n=1 Tax=uncultured Flavonifractor sp. TaxID=1193534 RepID=UPI0017486CDD|nr:M20/M25/M40 family metallo-hydrolase [uncultured Flavonifractor sp.]